MSTQDPLSKSAANSVYDVLVRECGASERNRESFVSAETASFITEYRFQGKLGFGGKFYRANGDNWYVAYYTEDASEERDQAAARANETLKELQKLAGTDV
jgi:hypothetical protein